MSDWVSVVVVSEDSIVVGKELTAENNLIVSNYAGAELRDEKVAALSGRGGWSCGKRWEWNNHVGAWSLSKTNLETEFPETWVRRAGVDTGAVAAGTLVAGECGAGDGIQKINKSGVTISDQAQS